MTDQPHTVVVKVAKNPDGIRIVCLAWETLKKGGLDYSENYHPNIPLNMMNGYNHLDMVNIILWNILIIVQGV